MLPESDLAATFRLTPAEARLAVRLLAGDSVKAAALALGISYQTARTILKSIFRKTGVRRQAELVLLFARAAVARRDGGR